MSLITALLRHLISINNRDVQSWGKIEISNYISIALKSNVPHQIDDLPEKRIIQILSNLGITDPRHQQYAISYLKAVALTKKAAGYIVYAPLYEMTVDGALTSYKKRQLEIDSRNKEILELLGATSLEEAAKIALTMDQGEKAAASINQLIQLIADQNTAFKQRLADMYKLVDEGRQESIRAATEANVQFGILLFAEFNALKNGVSPKMIIRRFVRFIFGFLTYSEIESIKSQIEEYFEVEQNCKNIIILANNRKI